MVSHIAQIQWPISTLGKLCKYQCFGSQMELWFHGLQIQRDKYTLGCAFLLLLLVAGVVALVDVPRAYAEEPVLRLVSVPDFINMDMQANDPRLFDLTTARQQNLVNEINSGGAQALINPNVGNFVGTVENGYRGASQVLLEALAAENAGALLVSGDLVYARWEDNKQTTNETLAQRQQHIRDQADIYYDGWIDAVQTFGGFTLDNIFTIVGDHEVGDNDWPASKRELVPTYREVYVDKVGNPAAQATGAYVDAPSGLEGRVYAVKRGSSLLVGIDQFETVHLTNRPINVTETQRQWLDQTLTQANKDPSIEHIFVLGHAPIVDNGVKCGISSCLKNETDESGALWQTLSQHNVDLYLPGEVHAISMQFADDVLQVVTGTNIFQNAAIGSVPDAGFDPNNPLVSEENYMVLDVFSDRIELTIKQIETAIFGIAGGAYDPVNQVSYKNREARVRSEIATQGFRTIGTLRIDTSGATPFYSHRTGVFQTDFTEVDPISEAVFGDLNFDGFVDASDWADFRNNFLVDLSEHSPFDQYARGDLNSDGINNWEDFGLFKNAYDDANGAGSFEKMLDAVPEPSTLALLTMGLLISARCYR